MKSLLTSGKEDPGVMILRKAAEQNSVKDLLTRINKKKPGERIDAQRDDDDEDDDGFVTVSGVGGGGAGGGKSVKVKTDKDGRVSESDAGASLPGTADSAKSMAEKKMDECDVTRIFKEFSAAAGKGTRHRIDKRGHSRN